MEKGKIDLILSRLMEFLSGMGVESYLIGGYVRDTLLGRATADIDIGVGAYAPEVAREVASTLDGRYVLLNEMNGIARVVFGANGGHIFLDFSTIRGGIEQDLARRDFTIDAMAVSLNELQDVSSHLRVIDPFGGQQDLKDKLVRAVSETSFGDDPARLLRAVRLAVELNFTIESGTENLISDQSHLVARVPGERIREELCHLLAARGAAHSMRTLDRLGLLGIIIPELNKTRGVEQPREHFWDVFEHSIETVAAVERLFELSAPDYQGDDILDLVPWSEELTLYFNQEVASGANRWTLLKLAALLHDIAKPQTKSIEENGRVHFLGHPKEGAEMVRRVLERLRFSNREIDMVEGMVMYHLRPTQMGNEGLPSRRAIYRYFRDVGDVAVDTLFLSLADHLASRGPLLDRAGWQKHTRIVEHILSEHSREESAVAPPKLINGRDLLDTFNLEPGPIIGELLEVVCEARAAGEVTSREEALELVRKLLNFRVGVR
jgi:poly(A) polymerase